MTTEGLVIRVQKRFAWKGKEIEDLITWAKDHHAEICTVRDSIREVDSATGTYRRYIEEYDAPTSVLDSLLSVPSTQGRIVFASRVLNRRRPS